MLDTGDLPGKPGSASSAQLPTVRSKIGRSGNNPGLEQCKERRLAIKGDPKERLVSEVIQGFEIGLTECLQRK
ncbi:hypothetical protein [Mesorhizobium silamurunense]|uniref:hypothetical protein n=1 Tax=Mesorhizobium silamurunense TaxID=499528 RepID=UPI00177CC1FC|nr:hypothetical protein [Mesorhizobium silamurunense]